MTTANLTLAQAPVAVHAPGPGEFDQAAFDSDLPAGGFYGLFVATTSREARGREQWHPGFRARLFGFATKDVVWVLDMDDVDQHRTARALLDHDSTTFATHSADHVVATFTHFGVDVAARTVCTQALGAMTQGADTSLEFLATQFVGPELEQAKERLATRFQSMWGGDPYAKRADIEAHGWETIPAADPAFTGFTGLAAGATRRLAEVLPGETGAPGSLVQMEVWLAAQAAAIQLRGVRVDADAVLDLSNRTKVAMEGPDARLFELTGLRATQGDRLREWLPEHGLDTRGLPTTKSGNLSLTREDLPAARAQATGLAAEALDALAERQEHADDLAKTQEWLRRMSGGRLHPVLSSVGAVTARMSCSAPNLQTVSKKLDHQRACFLPEPGHTLIAVDFDQVELRVAAALAGEQVMFETVRDGGDLHTLTAERTGVDRATAKVVNFLIVYGGGARALQKKTGKPLTECKQIIAAFNREYPAIKAMADRLAMETGDLVTITGRRIPVPSDGRSHANINYVIQSSARDLLVGAWWRMARQFPGLVWLPIHDELVLQVPDDQVEEVMDAAREAMNFQFHGMPISAEPVPLVDEDGVSRWMTADRAERLQEAREAAKALKPAPEPEPEPLPLEGPTPAYVRSMSEPGEDDPF